MILWTNGVPLSGIDETNDAGTTKFWHNGVPYGYIYEVTAANAIKKVSSITWASIKKINGVVLANIKKIANITA